MATTMKINKKQYLAQCEQALERMEAPEIAYQAAMDEWRKECGAWAKEVIAKKQIEARISTFGVSDFVASKDAPRQPKEPSRNDFYPKPDSNYWSAYPHRETADNIKKLREVVNLIRMTEGDTIGVSVANKVSHLL
jgi:hypothetical protein